jgi:hypothetical protein
MRTLETAPLLTASVNQKYNRFSSNRFFSRDTKNERQVQHHAGYAIMVVGSLILSPLTAHLVSLIIQCRFLYMCKG